MNTSTQKVMFSARTDEWRTPAALFDEWNRNEGPFVLDAAALSTNALCTHWLGPDHPDPAKRDALKVDWSTYGGPVYCNPPYSNVRDFCAAAAGTALRGAKVVLLVPARTDTRWFHDYIWQKPNVDIHFIKGRVTFVREGDGPKAGAPFPSMVVVFHPREVV